jgi:hypothetical protein
MWLTGRLGKLPCWYLVSHSILSPSDRSLTRSSDSVGVEVTDGRSLRGGFCGWFCCAGGI